MAGRSRVVPGPGSESLADRTKSPHMVTPVDEPMMNPTTITDPPDVEASRAVTLDDLAEALEIVENALPAPLSPEDEEKNRLRSYTERETERRGPTPDHLATAAEAASNLRL